MSYSCFLYFLDAMKKTLAELHIWEAFICCVYKMSIQYSVYTTEGFQEYKELALGMVYFMVPAPKQWRHPSIQGTNLARCLATIVLY